MKLHRKLFSGVLLGSLLLTSSCSYLDVSPFEKAGYEDTMKDKAAVLAFLSECYGGIEQNSIWSYTNVPETATDEYVFPAQWDFPFRTVWYGNVSTNSWSATNYTSSWGGGYDYLGYMHRFLNLLDTYRPKDVNDEDVRQYKAECAFLDGYYHFRLLENYGPIALVTSLVDPNITNSEIPGRSHFDYCVDYIVGKLDEAAAVLPSTITDNAELGRATSVVAKCIKARVLLYAASPLWNGSAPRSLKEWQNKIETPGYGKQLVAQNYDEGKWTRALAACQDALKAATDAGYRLYTVQDANDMADRDDLGLPYVPGISDKPEAQITDEDTKFLQTVRLFYYMPGIAYENNGNKELIWAFRHNEDPVNSDEHNNVQKCPMPPRISKTSTGTWIGGWCGFTPTMTAAMHFYTKDGKLPEKDPKFYKESEWLQRYYVRDSYETNNTGDLEKDEVAKYDVVKMNIGREPRFYAWIAFDGAQYMQQIYDGKPVWLNLKNSSTNGYHSDDARNYTGTGFFAKKFIDPMTRYSSTGALTRRAARRPLIRMAELYLNLAECYAALGNTNEAISNLNIIRERADVPDLTTADISSDMSLMDWVRAEKFIEFYMEGQRYYDLRRWCIAEQQLGANAETWYALDGMSKENPTFEEFNQRVKINQPYKWVDREYIMPVPTGSGVHDEYYSNPQMVQAPGY